MNHSIALYAPEAPPALMEPFGPATFARNTVSALRRAGFDVLLAARYMPGRDLSGERGEKLARVGTGLARRLARRIGKRALEARPARIVALRVNGGAPDLIGPPAARATNIPYTVIRAGVAESDPNANAIGLRVVNVGEGSETGFPLFLDEQPFALTVPPAMRPSFRGMIGGNYGLDTEVPWIVAPAMMRADKMESFRLLAGALTKVLDRRWQFIVAGDGPGKAEVAELLFPLGFERIRLVGALRGAADLPGLLAAADICAWPAMGEALALAGLEAQAAGLPVVACGGSGASGYIRMDETGLLAPPGSADIFARRLGALLDDADMRLAMGAAARANVQARHSLAAAAGRFAELFGKDGVNT
jgi:hypothetical protein